MEREGFIGKLSEFVDYLRETRREDFFDRSAVSKVLRIAKNLV